MPLPHGWTRVATGLTDGNCERSIDSGTLILNGDSVTTTVQDEWAGQFPPITLILRKQ